MFAAVDWLYSRIPVRFPNVKICLSEGEIGWVAGLIDRLEHVRMYDSMYGTWNDLTETPADVFRRNFWFCAIDDPSAYRQLDVMGLDNVMVESGLPARRLHVAERSRCCAKAPRRVCRTTEMQRSRGAMPALFRHPVPDAVAGSNAY
jgi:hypothetical protein